MAPRLGSGARFKALTRSGASPALAAWIGRRKYGSAKMAQMLTTVEHRFNQYVAVAERSFCVGYEAFVGAAVVTVS
jgi:hypothetical protein